MKSLIVYDLDGTLIDTLQDIAAAANHMLGELGRPALPAEEIRGYVGRGLHQLVEGCLKSDNPRLVERAAKLYRAYYAEHLADHSRLYPGVREVLERFKDRVQAVITNKPNPFTRDLLQTLGIAGYFSQVVAGDDGHPRKPDPSSLRAVLAAAGAEPEQAVLIGDSPIDVETGRRAGVPTAALAHGLADRAVLDAAQPTWLVADMRELLALAGREGW